MGKIKDWSIEDLKKVAKESYSMNEVLRKMNYKNRTSGRKALKELFKINKIDTSHFNILKSNKRKKLEHYLVNDSTLDSKIRRRVIHEIFKNKCSKCKNKGIWQGEELTIQLDHIDGNPFNNKIENLRPLCPNCHSQTNTFGSRNRKKIKTTHLCSCGVVKSSREARCCIECFFKEKSKKIEDIIRKKVVPLLGVLPMAEIGKEVGLATKTLHKYCKIMGIKTPGHSFWANKNKKRAVEKIKDKPSFSRRKYDYEKIYKHFLKTKNYAEVGRKFGIDKGAVRVIVLRHKKYIEKGIEKPKKE